MNKLVYLLLITIIAFFHLLVNAQNCSCTNYLYLNDTGLNYVEKFSIDSTTGALTEIGDAANGMPWLNAQNVVDEPHAIAIDLNGNLYIGENDQTNNEYNIQKFSCLGEKIDADLSTPAIDNFTNDGFSFNHFAVGNLLYTNIFSDFQTGTGDIVIYDLCTGNRVGCMREGYFWGFANGNDGYWYATGTASVGNFQAGIYRGLIDPAAYTDGAGGCGTFELFASNNQLGVPTGSRIMGIDQDAAGNRYIAVSAGGGFDPPSYIQKLDANGNVIAQSLTDTQFDGNVGDNLNWAGSRGVVYLNGFVYVSTGDDCIAVFDAINLTYQPSLSNNTVASFPKQLNLLKECCPTNSSLVIDTIVCNNSAGATFFLQDFLNCNGGNICEGEWAVATPNPNITYNQCNNTIALNIEEATCSTFTLTSNGTANNAQCGAFNLTINFETAIINAATISTDQITCSGGFLASLVASSPTVGVSYQWQSNTTGCDGSFSNIANATSSTYTPPNNNQTTYFRVLTSLAGNCGNKSCTEISNCISATINNPPPKCIKEFGAFIIQKN